MSSTRPHKKFVRFALLLGFILVDCSAPKPAPPPTIPPNLTQVPTTLPPTATSQPTSPPTATNSIADTASPTPIPRVRFAVIGDFGSASPDLAAVAALIDSWGVDFILTTGDNNYPIGAPMTIDQNIGQYFHSYIHPYTGSYGMGADENRFFPSMGNHDWMWLDGRPYLEYFELPGNERYYRFSWDFVDFFALSSDWDEPDGITAESVQGEWLQAELAASTAIWQVVFFHHAPFSSGYHGPTTHMQWPYQAWGADSVLSGHDHHYERLEIDGIPYLVQGLSGGQIYDLYQVDPHSQVRYNQAFGALLVEATPAQLRFRFYTIEGDLVDDFSTAQSN